MKLFCILIRSVKLIETFNYVKLWISE